MKLVRFVVLRAGFVAVASLIGLAFVLPLLWLLTAPFNAQATLRVEWPSPFTLRNFGDVFGNSFAIRALFMNSILQAGGTMVGTAVIATLAAYALSRLRIRGHNVLVYLLVLFSSVVTGTAAMVPIFLLLYYLRLIDTHLGVILVLTGGLLPTGIFLMRDFVESIPRSYEESALVSGATPWQIYWKIALPLAAPALATLGTFTFLGGWNAFLWPLIATNSIEMRPLTVGLAVFNTQFTTEWTVLMAGLSLATIPPIIVFLLAQKYFIRGLTLGSLKG